MVAKSNPFYKLIKAEVPINITPELENFDSVNKALSDACELALKQHSPGKQVVWLTGAIFRGKGYALMIDENPQRMIRFKEKRIHLWRSDQEIIPPCS